MPPIKNRTPLEAFRLIQRGVNSDDNVDPEGTCVKGVNRGKHARCETCVTFCIPPISHGISRLPGFGDVEFYLVAISKILQVGGDGGIELRGLGVLLAQRVGHAPEVGLVADSGSVDLVAYAFRFPRHGFLPAQIEIADAKRAGLGFGEDAAEPVKQL